MYVQPILFREQTTFFKILSSGMLAAVITFSIFAGMQKLISNDEIPRQPVFDYSPIDLSYDFNDKPTIERPKLPEIKPPQTKPKPIPKMLEATPDDKFDNTLYAHNFNGPVIKNLISPNFETEGGDARPIVRVEPKYPAVAANGGIEGWVKLSFSITPAGTVDNIKVLDAEPKRVFNQAARRALAKWKYKPNIVAGKAQSQGGMMVMLDFKLAS